VLLAITTKLSSRLLLQGQYWEYKKVQKDVMFLLLRPSPMTLCPLSAIFKAKLANLKSNFSNSQGNFSIKKSLYFANLKASTFLARLKEIDSSPSSFRSDRRCFPEFESAEKGNQIVASRTQSIGFEFKRMDLCLQKAFTRRNFMV